MRQELQKNYSINYQIHEDQLISAVVQVDWKEHYLPAYEINMLLAEWVHNNGRYYIDNEECPHNQEKSLAK